MMTSKSLYSYSGKGIYGYLMEVRGKEYKSFVSYLNGKNHFKDVRTMLDWCIKLCCSFKLLHEKGFSYQDLNDGSFLFNPDNGDLLICDNDNVCANKKNLGILGKMRYMAPEIVRGDIDKSTGLQQMPDVHSDRFSLSVILFMTLCMGHPYEGETMKNYDIIDEIAELEMYGKYGLYDAYNLEKNRKWVASDVIGIDKGISLLMIENYRSEIVWKYFMQNEYIQNAIQVLGFKAKEA